MWSRVPFTKSRLVITVACKQLSLGRRPLGDLSYPPNAGRVPVSAQDELRFPRRLSNYERYRRLSACSPYHQTTARRARPAAERGRPRTRRGRCQCVWDILDLENKDPGAVVAVTVRACCGLVAEWHRTKHGVHGWIVRAIAQPNGRHTRGDSTDDSDDSNEHRSNGIASISPGTSSQVRR